MSFAVKNKKSEVLSFLSYNGGQNAKRMADFFPAHGDIAGSAWRFPRRRMKNKVFLVAESQRVANGVFFV